MGGNGSGLGNGLVLFGSEAAVEELEHVFELRVVDFVGVDCSLPAYLLEDVPASHPTYPMIRQFSLEVMCAIFLTLRSASLPPYAEPSLRRRRSTAPIT